MDVDELSLLLIARLQLEDAQTMASMRKGKAREGVPLTDEEYAFQLQTDLLTDLMNGINDLQFAQSLGSAIDSDIHLVERFHLEEQAAADDHQYAAALSHSQPLPEKSLAQRTVESVPFVDVDTNQNLDEHPDVRDSEKELQAHTKVEINPVAGSSGSRESPTTCVICTDRVKTASSLTAPCGHQYCRGCLVDLVRACTGDESLYPLRCCKQNLPVTLVLPLLDKKTRTDFENKTREYDVESNNRLYCLNLVCSIFLGSAAGERRSVACTTCNSSICTGCRKAPHSGDCTENEALLEIKALAQEQGWQTCPGCHRIIELHHGCYHMTCRCRAEFCYRCAVPWKNCACPQWDEGRLVEAAQLRMQNEVGRQVDFDAPVVQQEVRQRVEHLRTWHDCDPHRWGQRWGAGNCEECGYYLNQFLKICRGCSMLACVRCTRNRL